MSTILGWLSGKKTYLLVLAYVILQLIQGGGLEGLAKPEELGGVVLALALGTLRAGIAKIGAPQPPA